MPGRAFRDFSKWPQAQRVEPREWVCAYCGNAVASDMGFNITRPHGDTPAEAGARICPKCKMLTIFDSYSNEWTPTTPPGKAVVNVPPMLTALYEEARASAGAGAPTAAVLICRKILMHVAVEEGADPGKSFVHYVEYLSSNGFIPPRGRSWVDYIRQRGNEANHEIVVMTSQDARALVTFVEMILRFLYEFPGLVPQPGAVAGQDQSDTEASPQPPTPTPPFTVRAGGHRGR